MKRARAGEPRAAPGQRDPQERRGFLRGGARPPVLEVTRYIDEQRATFGVEPICRALAIAPSSYYAARSRPPSARVRPGRGARGSTSAASTGPTTRVYGARKLWQALRREGTAVGRDQVGRLMRGARPRGRGAGQDAPDDASRPELAARPADLVERVFSAPAPNRLWVADLTYVSTWSGFCYTAFVIDAFSRRIVGWRVSAPCAPSSPSTPSRWRSGAAAATTSLGSSITATGASSTSPSATPSASPTRARSPRSARRATATTMPSPSR